MRPKLLPAFLDPTPDWIEELQEHIFTPVDFHIKVPTFVMEENLAVSDEELQIADLR